VYVLKDVRFRGMSDDVWGRVFGDSFVFAGQLFLSLAIYIILKEDDIPACWLLGLPWW
jgi:hypothetical protein